MIMVHVLTCIWWWQGTDSANRGLPSWITAEGIDPRTVNLSTAYITSFYFVLCTMSTLGPGDITPQNNYEMVLASFLMSFGGVGLAVFGAVIASLMAQASHDQSQLKMRRSQLTGFIAQNNVPPSLAHKLMQAFEKAVDATNEDKKSVDIRDTLPLIAPELRTEAWVWVKRKLLSALPALAAQPADVQAHLLEHMEQHKALPGEVLAAEDTPGECMFFLVSGNVIFVREGETLAMYGAGAYFGEIDCLYAPSRLATVIATAKCEYYAVPREALHDLCETHEQFGAFLLKIAAIRIVRYEAALPKGQTLDVADILRDNTPQWAKDNIPPLITGPTQPSAPDYGSSMRFILPIPGSAPLSSGDKQGSFSLGRPRTQSNAAAAAGSGQGSNPGSKVATPFLGATSRGNSFLSGRSGDPADPQAQGGRQQAATETSTRTMDIFAAAAAAKQQQSPRGGALGSPKFGASAGPGAELGAGGAGLASVVARAKGVSNAASKFKSVVHGRRASLVAMQAAAQSNVDADGSSTTAKDEIVVDATPIEIVAPARSAVGSVRNVAAAGSPSRTGGSAVGAISRASQVEDALQGQGSSVESFGSFMLDRDGGETSQPAKPAQKQRRLSFVTQESLYFRKPTSAKANSSYGGQGAPISPRLSGADGVQAQHLRQQELQKANAAAASAHPQQHVIDHLSLADRMQGSLQGLRSLIGDAVGHHHQSVGRSMGRNMLSMGRSTRAPAPWATGAGHVKQQASGRGMGESGLLPSAAASATIEMTPRLPIPGSAKAYVVAAPAATVQEWRAGPVGPGGSGMQASESSPTLGGSGIARTASFRPQPSPRTPVVQQTGRRDPSASPRTEELAAGSAGDDGHAGVLSTPAAAVVAAANGLAPTPSVGRIVGSLVDAHEREASAAARDGRRGVPLAKIFSQLQHENGHDGAGQGSLASQGEHLQETAGVPARISAAPPGAMLSGRSVPSRLSALPEPLQASPTEWSEAEIGPETGKAESQ